MKNKIAEFKTYLIEEEKSENTIEKYIRDVNLFVKQVQGKQLNKEAVIEYKNYLIQNYKDRSVNSMIASMNKFLEFLGFSELKVKSIKIQRELFLKPEKELADSDYRQLVKTAQKLGKIRLSLIIQTIASTGIRVSELQFITVESLKTARVTVNCKAKKRIVFLQKDLIFQLKKYCEKSKITKGLIFKTRTGKAIDRSNIWKMMKNLCKKAKVLKEKVFPHSLRHLFARTYYRLNKDISKLADLLGHSDINTTRIYTKDSIESHLKQLKKMNLVIIT